MESRSFLRARPLCWLVGFILYPHRISFCASLTVGSHRKRYYMFLSVRSELSSMLHLFVDQDYKMYAFPSLPLDQTVLLAIPLGINDVPKAHKPYTP